MHSLLSSSVLTVTASCRGRRRCAGGTFTPAVGWLFCPGAVSGTVQVYQGSLVFYRMLSVSSKPSFLFLSSSQVFAHMPALPEAEQHFRPLSLHLASHPVTSHPVSKHLRSSVPVRSNIAGMAACPRSVFCEVWSFLKSIRCLRQRCQKDRGGGDIRSLGVSWEFLHSFRSRGTTGSTSVLRAVHLINAWSRRFTEEREPAKVREDF